MLRSLKTSSQTVSPETWDASHLPILKVEGDLLPCKSIMPKAVFPQQAIPLNMLHFGCHVTLPGTTTRSKNHLCKATSSVQLGSEASG